MLMCILNVLTVLRMCYHHFVTNIKTYKTFQKVLLSDYDASVTLIDICDICDICEKYHQRSSEYQNYLIGREYNPTLVKKQFEEVGKMTRIQARASKQNPNQVKKINFFY